MRLRNECVEKEHRKAAKAAASLQCTILLLNPCRREAFVRCNAKNEKGLSGDFNPPLNKVFRVTWDLPTDERLARDTLRIR